MSGPDIAYGSEYNENNNSVLKSADGASVSSNIFLRARSAMSGTEKADVEGNKYKDHAAGLLLWTAPPFTLAEIPSLGTTLIFLMTCVPLNNPEVHACSAAISAAVADIHGGAQRKSSWWTTWQDRSQALNRSLLTL
eukprot:3337155-Rhodomonas_salina.3